ncbi:MAG: TRAM domain-containing protein, partial [Patescibacteria group bacterium]
PDISISTDLIVGFPGETDQDFQDSLDLFKEIKFNMAFIAQFSCRPGTAAAELKDDVTKPEKIRRDKKITEILKITAQEHNNKLVNTTQKVLVDKYRKSHWLGRTEGMVTVKFIAPKTKRLTGKFVNIKITKAEAFALTGTLV